LPGYILSRCAGAIVASFWVVLIIPAWPRKVTTRQGKKILICPECKKTSNAMDAPDQLCPICCIDIEKSDGFFERHNDLKTNSYIPWSVANITVDS
jgi:hypothetical protein